MTVRDVAVRAYREALPALSVSALGGLFAGLVLGGMEAELREISGLIVVVPALLATRGNIYGSLGARLATALHQGLIEPRVDLGDERLRGALAAAMATGLLMSAIAAVFADLALLALSRDSAGLTTLVAISLIAGFLSGLALTVAVVLVIFAGYRRGYDPDTLAGPVVTTTGDLVGVATLLFAARVVLGLAGWFP